MGYQRLTVNHTYNFVDPITHAHTNNVENFWMRSKVRNKKEQRTKNDLLDSYMIEFMWRQVIDDPFEGIISEIHIRSEHALLKTAIFIATHKKPKTYVGRYIFLLPTSIVIYIKIVTEVTLPGKPHTHTQMVFSHYLWQFEYGPNKFAKHCIQYKVDKILPSYLIPQIMVDPSHYMIDKNYPF